MRFSFLIESNRISIQNMSVGCGDGLEVPGEDRGGGERKR